MQLQPPVPLIFPMQLQPPILPAVRKSLPTRISEETGLFRKCMILTRTILPYRLKQILFIPIRLTVLSSVRMTGLRLQTREYFPLAPLPS